MTIKNKTILIGIILPLGALLLLTGISWHYLRTLAVNAIAANVQIGTEAARTSENALREYSGILLENIVRFRASYAEQRLARLHDSLQLLATMTEDVIAHTRGLDAPLLIPDDFPAGSISLHQIPGAAAAEAEQENFFLAQLDEILHKTSLLYPQSTVFLAGVNGTIRYTRNGHSRMPPDMDFRNREWYRNAVASRNFGWTEVYQDSASPETVVTAYLPVFQKHPGKDNRKILKIAAVAGIDMPIALLTSELLATPDGRNSWSFLLNENGKIVLSSAGDAQTASAAGAPVWKPGTDLRDIPEMAPVIAAMKKGQYGIHSLDFGGARSLIAYAPMADPEWGLCMVVPETTLLAAPREVDAKLQASGTIVREQLDAEILRSLGKYLAAALAAFITMSFLSRRIAGKIVIAIQTLSTGAARIGGGDFARPITVSTGDELQTLAEDFNRMARQLADYTARVATAERWQGEMSAAGDIQNNMLPQVFPPFPERREFSLYAKMRPAREIGGDFYDFFLVGESQVCLLVGDVSGKGIPAALFMAIGKTLIKNLILNRRSLKEAITVFNRIIAGENACEYFMTLFVALVDYRTGAGEYIDAGHNPPMLAAAGAEFQPLKDPKTKNPAVGMADDYPFRSGSLTLTSGSRLFLYTDGVTEAENTLREHYGEKMLLSDLNDNSDLDDTAMVNTLYERLQVFAGGQPAADDITMLMFTFK